MPLETEPSSGASTRDTPLGIFLVYLRLGCMSFGGPIAHLGYFRHEFVERRRWLDEAAFADVVALAQFVPGPASSQTGFALGLMRGGLPGGLAAWAGFTLPSALLMFLAARGLPFAEGAAAQGLIHGLQLLAVAVVAQAVWSMGQRLCPDKRRAALAFIAAALLIWVPGGFAQLGVIFAGALFGLTLLPLERRSSPGSLAAPIKPGPAMTALIIFLALLVGLPLAASELKTGFVPLAAAFYEAGALVFGGGHVVLPLLHASVVEPGWVSNDAFLAGYGAAQALPGPVFTFSAFLGAKASVASGGAAGATIALVAIFLPGMLLIYGILPFWDRLRTKAKVRAALDGVNAAVVGILGAALYQPIWTSAIAHPSDAAIALLAFAALTVAHIPVFVVVAGTAAAGMMLALA
jgi:chromate transporter